MLATGEVSQHRKVTHQYARTCFFLNVRETLVTRFHFGLWCIILYHTQIPGSYDKETPRSYDVRISKCCEWYGSNARSPSAQVYRSQMYANNTSMVSSVSCDPGSDLPKQYYNSILCCVVQWSITKCGTKPKVKQSQTTFKRVVIAEQLKWRFFIVVLFHAVAKV